MSNIAISFDSSYCFYLYDVFSFFCQVLPPNLCSWGRSNIEEPLASKSLFEYVETVFFLLCRLIFNIFFTSRIIFTFYIPYNILDVHLSKHVFTESLLGNQTLLDHSTTQASAPMEITAQRKKTT